MKGSTKPKRLRVPVFFAIFVCSWLLLGLVSSAVVVGSNFIPSAEWLEWTNPLRVIVGSLSAALFVWIGWKGAGMSKLKRVLGVIVGPFVGYFMGSSILFIWPLLLPLIAGDEVALPFKVLRLADRLGKNCHSAVMLEDTPFLIGRVCNVPDDIRLRLSPGIGVFVRGWGTRLGVYAHALSLTSTDLASRSWPQSLTHGIPMRETPHGILMNTGVSSICRC
ncbi:hypothetical protein [Rhizobium sp. 768_B6_N1_8]|uniref:hypothetical protein n=1 Tax=unclassified Rhizobium TaxID=2613769 RepID=UPI003F297F63